MTAPVFRPIGGTAFDDDSPLHSEGGRRIVRDTLAVLNERCVQIGGAFQREDGAGTGIRTLWRWSASWSYMGPWHVYVPPEIASRQGTIRVLIRLLTNGGNGAVRVVGVTGPGYPEASMTAVTNAATVGEQYYFRCASTSLATSFAFALRVPVVSGWNEVRLAIRCEIDADRAATTDTGPFGAFTDDDSGAMLKRIPVLLQLGTETDYFGAVIETAESSALHAAGFFETYTIPYDFESGNDRFISVFEPSISTWLQNGPSASPSGLATIDFIRLPFVTVAQIESISIDGSCDYELEDREFGAWARYLQLASGTIAAGAVNEAQSAHRARLPMAAVVSNLDGIELEPVDRDNGYPRIYQAFAMDVPIPTYVAFRTALIGIGPSVEIQDVLATARTWELRLSLFAGWLPVAEGAATVALVVRAQVLRADGTAITTVEQDVQVPAVRIGGRDRAIEQQLSGWLRPDRHYMAEGMFIGSDRNTPVPVTIRIDGAALAAEPVQRLVVAVKVAPDLSTVARTIIAFAGPLAVRLADGS